jgi:hypothetical protein
MPIDVTTAANPLAVKAIQNRSSTESSDRFPCTSWSQGGSLSVGTGQALNSVITITASPCAAATVSSNFWTIASASSQHVEPGITDPQPMMPVHRSSVTIKRFNQSSRDRGLLLSDAIDKGYARFSPLGHLFSNSSFVRLNAPDDLCELLGELARVGKLPIDVAVFLPCRRVFV